MQGAPTLTPGDLVVVRFNSGVSGAANDSVSLLSLAAIPAGSVVMITDHGWRTSFFTTNTVGAAGRGDGTLIWTAPAGGVAAGVYLHFVGDGTSVTASSGSAGTVTGDFGTTGLQSTSESIIIYQTANNAVGGTPTFIYGFNQFPEANRDAGNGWTLASSITVDNEFFKSTLPGSGGSPGITALTAVTADAGLGTAYGRLANQFNYIYVGPTTAASKNTWLQRVHTTANWQSSSTVFAVTDGSLDEPPNVGGSAVAPTVATPTSTAVTGNSASLGGSITATGGADATARGVVYALTSQNANPEIGGANVTVLTESGTFSTGAFTRNATSLAASSGYSYKAYATNSAGTSYSSVGTFTTTAASATIIFNATTGISGTVVTDGQGGSNDVPNIALQFSAKAADGTTDLPMTYQPNIYAGANGVAGGYNSSSIQSVFKIKSSSTATNFTMSSIFIVDYGGVDGDLLRIEAFDDGVSAGFITYQVSGAPWYDTVDLATLGGTKFVDIDEVRITGSGGVNMYIAVNNVTISGITTSASTATVSSLTRANPTPSNLNTVNWTLTFGSAVTGVTASNFTLGGTSTGASVGTPTTANAGLSWTVPVTTGTDGTLLLRLDNDTSLSSDITTTLPFVGETYTIDKTAPDTSITANPALLTTSTGASFSFTGSDAGSGVASYQVKLDLGSFATGTSPTSYTSLVDGSHTFQVRAVDAAGNVDASPASYTWTVDTTPPQVLSVTRLSPSAQAVSSATVTFRVTYSEAVTLNAPATSRYAVVPVSGSSITGTVTGVSGTGNIRDVTVSITGGTGEFRLRVVD
ncbi:hypothetical protein GCM10023213_19520 [Prosthecobacter algae]|uniref:Ig-like domain-containing protein n=1 Tax=Prosthecobacter algae TaxID=1144682 RepID=A0ABP9P2C0_9BACT